jgi:hypothetical protein
MSRTRLTLSFLVLSALLTMPLGPAGSQECGEPPAMPALAFDQPKLVDEVRAGGEPSVEGLADGTLLYASHASTTLFYRDNMPDPDYVTPYTGATYIWRSTDGGDNWRYVGLAGTEVGPHATVSGFSDPDFAVDTAGNVYTSGINLANVYVAKSEDSGATWTGHPVGVEATDREWLAADEEDVVYLNGNHLGFGRSLWKSTDGGLTFNPTTRESLPGGGPPSKIEVDQTDGRLYFPNGSGMSIFPSARNDDFTRADAEVPGGTPNAHGFLNDMAIDRAGNVYIVSNSGTEVFVSHSTDRGLTWTTTTIHDTAVDDSTPENGPNEIMWPWISAGEDGRVGVSWFQADRPVPNTETVPADYRVFAAQTVTGHGWTDECGTERGPVYEVAVATPQPFHQGTICSSGTTCQIGGIDRRLGDYHTNSISADGRFLIAYSNTAFKPESAVSKPAFVRQASGVDFVDDGVVPTEVTGLDASVEGATVAVSGGADFGEQAPQVMAVDAVGDGPTRREVDEETGVDLTRASIRQPDGDDPTLLFEWKVANLPAAGSLPEAVRYTFPFLIGQKSFQPQAKLTNLASITMVDDAPGHARPPGHFQLRGNCVTSYPPHPLPEPVPPSPVANCPHVAWLDGEFDTATNTVRIELPIGAEFASEIQPGALIEPGTVAGTTITASYQAVVSNATTTDEAPWEGDVTYTVPDREVALGIAPAGTDPSAVAFDTPAGLDGGAFTGSVDVSGLEPGEYEVFARACFAGNCAVSRTPVTVG